MKNIREGNYIKINGIIKKVTLTMIFEGGMDNYCEKIKITNQLLLDLSFTVHHTADMREFNGFKKKFLIIYAHPHTNQFFIKYNDEIIYIEYISDVQNLFLCLNGNELFFV